MRNRFLAILCGVVLLTLPVRAQQSPSGQDDSRHVDLKVHFVVNNNVLDTSYSYNGYCIREFLSRIEALRRDSLATFTRAEVVGSASPEGYQDNNFALSINRANALRAYIGPSVGLPPEAWSVSGVGSNWDELDAFSVSLGKKYHDEVSRVVKEVPLWVKDGGRIVGGRKKSLMELNDGEVWAILGREVFPELRKATLTLHYYTSPDTTSKYVPVAVGQVDMPSDSTQPSSARRVLLALKTNLLYDACMSPTLGIEVPIGRKFSLAGEWTYAWWNNDSRHFCWRSYGGDLAFRWWFARKDPEARLTGHHLGVYGQMFTFDYMFDENKGIQSSDWNYGAGLEYGYSLPIAKSLNLDFSIGVGHIWGEYDSYWQYREGDNIRYIRSDTRSYPAVFPTKAEISLVWLIK